MSRKRLLAPWLAIASFAVGAEPSININTDYYSVSGTDSSSIRQSILQNGPAGNNGKRFHAYTQWNVSWSYRWIESHSLCRLNGLKVNIDIDYMLPKLNAIENIPQALRDNWKLYFDALFKHEQQHKDYGLEAARELENSLLALPQLPCSEFETTLADSAGSVLERAKQQERKFDLETDHGINQGITLP